MKIQKTKLSLLNEAKCSICDGKIKGGEEFIIEIAEFAIPNRDPHKPSYVGRGRFNRCMKCANEFAKILENSNENQ